MNPLIELQKFGQAFWLDYIRRSFLTSGELDKLVTDDGLQGVTSNPSIFEKAIAGSTDYAAQLEGVRCTDADSTQAAYESLAIRDIQSATGILQPVYQKTGKRDGYVSLEVSPGNARHRQGTMDEAHRLWDKVGRPNLMVKVPATEEGIAAMEELIASGINVNVTLLFDQEVYQRVAETYIRGVQRLADSGGDLSAIASVASFFVSRIDTAVDNLLNEKIKSADPKQKDQFQNLVGKIAIANAKGAYVRYRKLFESDQWQKLASKGAHTQRLLWASTSTKNPKLSDVLYIEELIGRDTVNTMPQATAAAFRDHGKLRDALSEDPEAAAKRIQDLEATGISLKQVTANLLTEGLKLFSDAFDQLLAAIQKAVSAPKDPVSGLTRQLPKALEPAVEQAIEDWQANGKVKRLWEHDATLWTGQDEAQWLGWLTVTNGQLAHLQHLRQIAADAKSAGYRDAVVLGMGGSSLCPGVLSITFGKQDSYPELHVLDSTDPAQIAALEKKLDLANTLFIVSSKSGTTLEPNIYQAYFYDRVKQTIGEDKVGSRFVAITDPGSKLETVAHSQGFRRVFFGLPSIGGRYSALSDFGMVPGAIMGLDIPRLIDRAEIMVHACASCVPAKENPGVELGAILGTLGNAGRNKVTLLTSPGLVDLGAWLEQLLAESTGKDGKGLIPIDREPLGPPDAYGGDRVFVYTRLASDSDTDQSQTVDLFAAYGHPVVRIVVKDVYDLGQEFFRWEFATAVAGSILGINAFNQPDVEASKVATRRLTSEYEKTGKLAGEHPVLDENGLWLFADAGNAIVIERALAGQTGLTAWLRSHLNRLHEGDYFALLAYIEMNREHERALEQIRIKVRDHKRVATCLGFGPRFLHSTGQAYKGGPNTGVFLQITCNDAADLAIPAQQFTFSVVKAAQALGDLQVLQERNRRALRLHITGDAGQGLQRLSDAVRDALA
ncbi:MAG: bifunctional transaldolase/phosoglucose isomerase [Bryobacteraceae bacterium]